MAQLNDGDRVLTLDQDGKLSGADELPRRYQNLLKKALSTGLRMKTDQAMAKLNLAGIAMAKRRKREAQILLTEAKKLDTRKLLDEQIKMLQAQMKRL